MNKLNQDKGILRNRLLECIERDEVCPRSKAFFRCRESLVWTLWFLSILVGSVAVAVSFFVVTHRQYAFYEATHDNLFTSLVDALPYLWIIIFGLMVYVAIYNFRHTSTGYRYPIWIILGSSLVVSFVGGTALNMLGFGYAVDDILGDHMAMYLSQEKIELKTWQSPEEGRLLGRQVYSTLAPTTTIIFKDYSGDNWKMNVSELNPRDVDLLSSGEKVRVLGKYMDGKMRVFHACGAFPLMMNKNTPVRDMIEERKAFIERVLIFAERRMEMERTEDIRRLSAASSSEVFSVCATIIPVQRMPYKPHDCVESCQD